MMDTARTKPDGRVIPKQMDAPSENKVVLSWVGLTCAFLIGQAIQINNGHFHPLALGLVGLAVGASFVGVVFSKQSNELGNTRWLLAAIAAVLCLQFVQLFTAPPGIYLTLISKSGYTIYYGFLAIAAFAVSGCLSRHPFWGKWTFKILAAAFLGLGVWIIVSSPDPKIDVFVFYTQAARAVFNFHSPYALSVPNIYGHTMFYDPALVSSGVLDIGFPYFPVTAIFAVPGYLLGDVRFAHLLAVLMAGIVIALICPGPFGRAFASIYWFTPRGFFTIEQSWTEPFMVAGLAICVCVYRSLFGAALGMLLSMKQSLLFVLPIGLMLTPSNPSDRFRFFILLCASWLLLVVPWILADPDGFWHSVVALQFRQPFRPDALTVSALLSSSGVSPFSASVAFMFALLGLVFVLLKSARSAAAMCVSVNFVYLVFFALNKQAFCNYYYFIIGSACVGAAAASRSVITHSGPNTNGQL
jgi:hypothetical protein